MEATSFKLTKGLFYFSLCIHFNTAMLCNIFSDVLFLCSSFALGCYNCLNYALTACFLDMFRAETSMTGEEELSL